MIVHPYLLLDLIEEIDRSRSTPLPRSASAAPRLSPNCPAHKSTPLLFLCVQCETEVCLDCVQTANSTHFGHVLVCVSPEYKDVLAKNHSHSHSQNPSDQSALAPSTIRQIRERERLLQQFVRHLEDGLWDWHTDGDDDNEGQDHQKDDTDSDDTPADSEQMVDLAHEDQHPANNKKKKTTTVTTPKTISNIRTSRTKAPPPRLMHNLDISLSQANPSSLFAALDTPANPPSGPPLPRSRPDNQLLLDLVHSHLSSLRSLAEHSASLTSVFRNIGAIARSQLATPVARLADFTSSLSTLSSPLSALLSSTPDLSPTTASRLRKEWRHMHHGVSRMFSLLGKRSPPPPLAADPLPVEDIILSALARPSPPPTRPDPPQKRKVAGRQEKRQTPANNRIKSVPLKDDSSSEVESSWEDNN